MKGMTVAGFDKEILSGIVEAKLRLCMDNWDALTPMQQWDVVIRLLPYVTPKLSATAVQIEKKSGIRALLERISAGSADADIVL